MTDVQSPADRGRPEASSPREPKYAHRTPWATTDYADKFSSGQQSRKTYPRGETDYNLFYFKCILEGSRAAPTECHLLAGPLRPGGKLQRTTPARQSTLYCTAPTRESHPWPCPRWAFSFNFSTSGNLKLLKQSFSLLKMLFMGLSQNPHSHLPNQSSASPLLVIWVQV